MIDGETVEHRVIGSFRDVVHAPSDSDGVRSALATPSTTIVSVTVTEKGYRWEPAARLLDWEHPDVHHDLAAPTSPRSLPGHLVLAAADRRAQSTGPAISE